MTRQRAAMPMFEQATRGENERVFLVGCFHARLVFQIVKFALAPRKTFGKKKGCAEMIVIPYRGLEPLLFNARVFHARVFRNNSTHFFKYFRGRLVRPERCVRAAELLFDAPCKIADDLPIGARLAAWLQRLAHALNAAVGVGERAFLFRPRSRW